MIPAQLRVQYLQSMMKERRQEVAQDQIILELVNSLKNYRNIDNSVTDLIKGVPVDGTKILGDIIKDRVNDYRTAQLVGWMMEHHNLDRTGTDGNFI